MSPDSSRSFGTRIETQALRYFLGSRAGSRLVARNVTSRVGEIDLVFEEPCVSRDGKELVFVEVRARLEGNLARGFECVDAKKRRRLRLAIDRFLASYRGRAETLRVDFMVWDGLCWNHLVNAWLVS